MLAYPGYGFQLPDGSWQISVSGVVWQAPKVFNRRQKMLIRMVGGVMQATPEELESPLFLERVTPFLSDCDTRLKMEVVFGDKSFSFSKKTKRTGRFEQWFILDADTVKTLKHPTRETIAFKVSCKGMADDQSPPAASNEVYLIPRLGMSIITDIDDTIKDSSVGNRRALLQNTFLRNFKSVDQMAKTYREWESTGSKFHYVSASPWQLFESLDRYLKVDNFPQGTLHLRNFRLRDQLLKKVILHRKGKRFAIQKLIRNLSARRFILIGDSSEKDPEIYRKVCRKFPGNIAGLFIRDLEHNPMTTERWRKICDSLPGGICERFNDGDDLREKAASLFEQE